MSAGDLERFSITPEQYLGENSNILFAFNSLPKFAL